MIEKTLWRSNFKKSDDTLIITEAPIDAISYEVIHNLSSASYVATCGGFSSSQSDMIKDFVEGFSQFKKIIIATDNNAGGNQIAERLFHIIETSKFNGSINRHSPSKESHDWSNVLMG
ncbi:MAG: toprim domain-containing protein [Okeania sp. SIO3C4]|nr:toprim domain-containing protein [Okeania sp. SIO3C4]